MDASLSKALRNPQTRDLVEQHLDDLCVRFIIHLPQEELQSVERICFQIEEAHWYYEDFFRETYPELPGTNLRNFMVLMFGRIPESLLGHIPVEKFETAFTDFMNYKTRVPVRGVIMLNAKMDRCVLVKGWKNGASWCFPRGKIDQSEDDKTCAIREVDEETGFDLDGMIEDNDYLEVNRHDQNIRLYIAVGVPEDAQLAPKTRKEISKIAWHELSGLPGYLKRSGNNENDPRTPNPSKFYMVAPFARELRKWISTNQSRFRGKRGRESRRAQAADVTVDKGGLSSLDQPSRTQHVAPVQGDTKAAQPIQMDRAQQDEASQRLKEMLHGGSRPNGNASHSKPNGVGEVEQARAKTLLSILKSGGPSSANETHSSAPSAGPPNPSILSTSTQRPPPLTTQPPSSLPPNMVTAFPVSGPLDQQIRIPPVAPAAARYQGYPPHQQQQQQQQQQRPTLGPAPLKSNNGPNGWTRQPGLPNSPMADYLPSPPPTSRYGMPPLPLAHPHLGSHHGSRGPLSRADFPPAPRPPPVSLPGPQLGSGGYFNQQAPPTPVEAFLPVPNKPQDPNQAGALLSILKGNDSPAVTKQENQPPRQTGQQAAKPSAPPVALQAPPPPRAPRNSTHVRSAQPPAPQPSTSGPPSQALTPPAKPRITQPPLTPSLASGASVLDQYTNRTPSNVPAPTFDRRNSVSGEQAKTLLALFKATNGSPTAVPASKSVVSSPERGDKRPIIPAIERLSSPGGAQRNLKVLDSKNRADLRAFLEDVAKSSGL